MKIYYFSTQEKENNPEINDCTKTDETSANLNNSPELEMSPIKDCEMNESNKTKDKLQITYTKNQELKNEMNNLQL